MDEALRVVVEMNECVWKRFKDDLEGVTAEEANWRPLPHANSINLILRHVRLDAPWHVAGIERSELARPQDPAVPTTDPVPLDFERNLRELDESCRRFIGRLRAMTLADLQQRTAVAYDGFPQGQLPEHFLGFHLALHLAAHDGQVRTLRNLYRKTRGEPAAFFPDNPTFPT